MAYANIADIDQIASDKGLHCLLSCTICHSTMCKKQNLGKKVWSKVFKILGNLSYSVESTLTGKSSEQPQNLFWFQNRKTYQENT